MATRGDPSRRNPVSRFVSSRVSSNLVLNRQPPIVLEWSDAVVRIGYADQSCPQQLLPIPQQPFVHNKHDHDNKCLNDNIHTDETKENEQLPKVSSKQKSTTQWIFVLTPIIYKIYYDCLMETDPSTRRVVCCISGLFCDHSWEKALLQIFWSLGVPAVMFVSGLQVVPLVLGWRRGMVVSVCSHESHCMAYMDGHALQNSYQVVPFGSSDLAKNGSSHDAENIPLPWWLDSRHPHSLTLALMKCLALCPRDALKDISSNLVFYGEDLVKFPDLGNGAMVALKDTLVNGISSVGEQEELEMNGIRHDLTMTPTNATSLHSIVDYLALTSTSSHRPDLMSWTGTCIWASMLVRHGFEDSKIGAYQNNWIAKPNT